MPKDINDMQKLVDPATILSEARMMYTDCNMIYILIEGNSDKRFFKALIDPQPNIFLKPVAGWEQVYKIIELSHQEGYKPILGIIDRDYHALIEDGITESDQLLFTDKNDIEMMLFSSKALEKFLFVCGDEQKLKTQTDLRTPITTAASLIGALRAISLYNHYNLDFDRFECKNFVDRNTLAADCNKLTEKILQRTRSNGGQITVQCDELISKITEFIQKYSADSLCNGHDVLEILAIAMTKFYSSSSANQYTADNLFDYLLVGYSVEEFKCSRLSKGIENWVQQAIK
ncbi:MAG: DUF4435 domain-containing protein [Eubacteriales bacterium]|nr:DUF4435 domain-containing protein [Eubacteriales bacterium]